jgi:TPR repeat protein
MGASYTRDEVAKRKKPRALEPLMKSRKMIPLAVTFVLLTLIIAGQCLAEPLEAAKTAYDQKDYLRALSLWRPLADEGNAEAQRFVGILYDNGLAVSRDSEQAVDWFRKAASQGDSEAEYRLGMMFVHGRGGLP